MRIEPGVCRSMTVLVLPPSGQSDEHHLLSPLLFSDPAAHLVAVQSWQANIEQHDIGSEPRGSLDCRYAVVRLMRFVTAKLQQHRQ